MGRTTRANESTIPPVARRAWSTRAIRAGLAIIAVVAGAPESVPQPSRWTAEAWIEDLDYLETQIRAVHGNPFHTLDTGDLRAGFRQLRAEIPTLSDFEIAFGMQRLVASLGDGHSWLYYYKNGLSEFFLFDAYEFSDGLFITHAGGGHNRAIGGRVVAIDVTPIADVRKALLPYVSRDNEMDALRQMPLLVRQPFALHAAGVTRSRNEAAFTLETRAGETIRTTFRGMPEQRYEAWRGSIETPDDAPMYVQKKDDQYWYKQLPEAEAVYFQFNRFQDKFEQNFAAFTSQLFGYLDTEAIDFLIIDLRHNAGGWTRLIDPLLDAIRKRPRFQQRGNLYVITGRDTFSSALMLSVRLERETEVIFAGEPGTGKPNSYGEYTPYTLPNTQLKGSLSSKYHQESEPLDPRTRVEVDLPAPLSYEDFVNHRDPALNAVLDHRRGRQP